MSLVIITFFASIQYIFYAGVPDYISTFEFLFITSTIGFILLLCTFANELFRIDKKHTFRCFILAIESFAFNLFLVIGSNQFDSTTVSGVISSYFIFIPLAEFIIYKSLPKISIVVAIVLVLTGLFFMLGMDVTKLMNRNIIFLLLADIMVTINIITIGNFAKSSNPAILSMGQLFFTSIISFTFWMIESKIKGTAITIPKEPLFWGSAIFVSFFLRGLYSVVQIYAQRYVSPINVSLIFSSEIIMTMFFSNTVSKFFGYQPNEGPITVIKVIGAIIMLSGILLSEINPKEVLCLVKGKNNDKD